MEKQEGIVQSSIKSGAWMFARQFVIRMINLVAVAILARHVSPAGFGLAALAQVVLQFLVLSQTNGIGTYVIYDRAPGWENRSHSAFWLNFVITVVELGILFGALPLITRFYVQPELPYMLVVLGATYFIQQLGVVPDSLIQRKLKFRPIVIRDTLLNILSGILGVAMALTGWGIWSLVIPTLIIQPINVVASFAIARWRPVFPLDFHSREKKSGKREDTISAQLSKPAHFSAHSRQLAGNYSKIKCRLSSVLSVLLEQNGPELSMK